MKSTNEFLCVSLDIPSDIANWITQPSIRLEIIYEDLLKLPNNSVSNAFQDSYTNFFIDSIRIP